MSDPVPPSGSGDAMSRMENIFARQKQAYAAEPMPSPETRRAQLATLKALLLAHQMDIARAINGDFTARSTDETLVAEIMPCIKNIDYAAKRLRGWMKLAVRHVGLHLQPARARVVYQPLGVVGIMVPFNYPVMLAIEPLVAALAAGNRAMIKMSEFTPRMAELLGEMLRKGFGEDSVAVVTGGAEVATAFSKLPFDHLLFTGSVAVGKLVMRAAADNLIPVTLELGGKSPAIFADDIPIRDFIDRFCFGKTLNAGQTCIAPDYVLVPRAKVEEFTGEFTAAFGRMFPMANGNPDRTSLIHARSHARLQALLKDAAEKGARILKLSDEPLDDGTFRMPFHLVLDVKDDMKIMQEEIFGPVLPVIPYDSTEQAIAFVNARPRPLALYLFSNDAALRKRVMTHTHAGSMCINEAVLQVAVDDLPFGGIGPSGMGHYHGHEGFLTMSKAKAVYIKGRLNPMAFLYPPYGGRMQAWLHKLLIR